jgi:hypothetical protein
MAESSGLSIPVISDMIMGRVTQILSPTTFLTTIKGYGDSFFQDWDVFVARDAAGAGAAPQGDKQSCNAYVSASGYFSVGHAFDSAPLAVGDLILVMHPFVSENVLIIDIPSNDLKQSDDAEVTTAAGVLTKVKELAWTGSVGGCRVKFDMRIQPGGGLASAVIYKNGVPITTNPAATPIWTVHTDATGVYVTFSQDIYGLVTGDLIQVYAMAAGGTTFVRNFRIYYDIFYLPSTLAAIDSVYFDQVNGVAGTDWPIGTVGQPSNNYADTMAIAAARNLNKITLLGGGTFAITTNFTKAIVGSPYCAITVAAGLIVRILSDLECLSFTNTTGNIRVFGSMKVNGAVITTTGPITVLHDLEVLTTTTTAAILFVYGNARLIGAVTINGNGAALTVIGNLSGSPVITMGGVFPNLIIYGNAEIAGLTVNSGIATVLFDKNLFCSGIITNAANGGFVVNGVLDVVEIISADDLYVGLDCIVRTDCTITAGTHRFYGNLSAQQLVTNSAVYIAGNYNGSKIAGAANSIQVNAGGTLTIGGYCYTTIDRSGFTGNIVIIAGGTMAVSGALRCLGTITNGGTLTYGVDVTRELPEPAVNITATNAAETDFLNLPVYPTRHYYVKSVTLKCADPGANSVAVRLYLRVNNVLVNVSTFTITNANFANYFNLFDMFGKVSLAGDQLQVTVRASAGGPYVVTGQYALSQTD